MAWQVIKLEVIWQRGNDSGYVSQMLNYPFNIVLATTLSTWVS